MAMIHLADMWLLTSEAPRCYCYLSIPMIIFLFVPDFNLIKLTSENNYTIFSYLTRALGSTGVTDKHARVGASVGSGGRRQVQSGGLAVVALWEVVAQWQQLVVSVKGEGGGVIAVAFACLTKMVPKSFAFRNLVLS